MFKKIVFYGSLLVVLSASVASAAITTINFEAFAVSASLATVNATTTPMGVTFGIASGTSMVSNWGGATPSPLSGNTLTAFDAVGTGSPPVLTATFAGAGTRSEDLKVDAWDTNVEKVRFDIYDGATLRQSVTLTGVSGTITFTSGFMITRMEMVDLSNPNTSPNGDGFVIDNLMFTAPVPEPGTFVLMGAGLGLLGLLRRRKA